MKKQFTKILLTLALVLLVLPVIAVRVEASEIKENNEEYVSDSYGALYSTDKTELIRVPEEFDGTFVVPEGVVTIKKGAFANCANMKAVDLPESLLRIEESAFLNCTGLSELTIPKNLIYFGPIAAQSVPDEVGEPLKNLKKITFLGDTPPEFAKDSDYWDVIVYPFSNITATVYFPGMVREWWFVREDYGGNVTWEPYGGRLDSFSGTLSTGQTWVVTENTLTISGEGAIMDSRECDPIRDIISKVVIGEGITSVSGFDNYTELTDIDFPEGIKKISGFDGCTGLTELDFPDGVTFVDGFDDCTSLTNVHFPEGIVRIGTFDSVSFEDIYCNGAFDNCTGLTEVDFPAGLNYICGFNNCTGLTRVYFPKGTIAVCGFSNCEKLTGIDFPEGVGSITGFQNCTGLKELVFPSSLPDGHDPGTIDWGGNSDYFLNYLYPQGVGVDAFKNCMGLTEITFPKGAVYIGSGAFNNCTALKKIVFQDYAPKVSGSDLFAGSTATVYYPENNVSWTESVKNAFSDTLFWKAVEGSGTPGASGTVGGLTWTIADDTLTISGNGALSLDDYNQYPWKKDAYLQEYFSKLVIEEGVTEIGNSAFYGCTGLTSVEISEGVTAIRDSAFHDCTNLERVIFPKGLEVIGVSAFEKCTNLKEVVLEEGLKRLDGELYDGYARGAFCNCTSLEKVILPEGLESIGPCVFERCKSLKELHIPSTVTNIAASAFSGTSIELKGDVPWMTGSSGDIRWELSLSGKLTISGTGPVTVEGGTNSPWYGYGEEITSVVVEEGITALCPEMFYYCNMVEVELPDRLTEIPRMAFYECDSLKQIRIPKNATVIGNAAFYNCAFSEITIPDGVTEIGKSAFTNCKALTEVTIPENVTVIGEQTFANCDNLQTVNLPEGLLEIQAQAFSACKNLTQIEIPDNVTAIGEYAFSGCSGLTEIMIPDGVTVIGEGTFSDCTGLTEIVISDSVTEIGEHVFNGCIDLTEIVIPDSVTEIGDGAFTGCTGLTGIVIPDSVTAIGEYVFNGCTGLTGVVIPDSVTEIGDGAFTGCTGLTEIVIPDSVTAIGEYVFNGCTGLTKIVIPDRIKKIAKATFSSCSSLTEVVIPAGVTEIDEFAFNSCENLKEIYFCGNAPKVKGHGYWPFDNAFGSNGITANAYYPKNDPTWTEEIREDYGGNITWISYTPCKSHSYGAWETTAANCTKIGHRTRVCKVCGLPETEMILPLGHDYKSSDGITFKCSRCDDSYTLDVEDILKELSAGTLTEAKAVEAIQSMGVDNLKNQLADGKKLENQLKELESLMGGSVTVQATNMDAASVSIVGAKLNAVGKDVTLRISAPAVVKQIPEGYENGIVFSMTLENVADVENLRVPVKISMPLPAGLDPNRVLVLHYNADGTLKQTIEPKVDGSYVNFVLTGFCDFAITQKHIHEWKDGFCACGAEEPKGVYRLAGSSRYETSFAIANEMKEILGVDKFDTIILANSDNFADALAGSYLAAMKKAPIIIGKLKYAGMVCDYVNQNLNAGGTVYVLGGEGAVPEAMLSGITVTKNIRRLAGDNRYDTNLVILKTAGITGKDVLVATGQDFADSLSASATGLPILLVNGKPGKTLSEGQKALLAAVTGKIYIIGGESAVPESMVQQIEAASGKETERIAGGSRYETSVKIAEKFLSDAESAVVAYASTFPDGLCGGPLAYTIGAPLLLTKDGKREAPDYTTGNYITSGYVLGGDGLISDGFAKQIFQVTEITK